MPRVKKEITELKQAIKEEFLQFLVLNNVDIERILKLPKFFRKVETKRVIMIASIFKSIKLQEYNENNTPKLSSKIKIDEKTLDITVELTEIQ